MIRNKKNEARSANKARKEMEKDDKKRKRAVDKASKSAEKATSYEQRENDRTKSTKASLRLFSQSSYSSIIASEKVVKNREKEDKKRKLEEQKIARDVKKAEKKKDQMIAKEIKASTKILEEEFNSERLEELRKNILNMQWIEESDIDLMKKNENYKLDPNLALAVFHCCGANPKANVHNNESLLNDTTGVEERISNEMENDLSHEEVACLKNDVVDSLSKNKPLWVCASCCEMTFLSNCKVSAHHTSISDLHCNFKICEEEVLEINENYDEEVVNKHFSIFKENDRDWCYLNPDLIESED